MPGIVSQACQALVEVILLDITIFFGVLTHFNYSVLVSKLVVVDNFIGFMSNFLNSRSIRVVVDGFTPNIFNLNALSSSLFFNHLRCVTQNPVYSFADDSTMSHPLYFTRRNIKSRPHKNNRIGSS